MTNFDIIIARYGEIHLKGANRGVFLRALARNIEQRINQKVRIESSRIFIDCSDQTVAKKLRTLSVL